MRALMSVCAESTGELLYEFTLGFVLVIIFVCGNQTTQLCVEFSTCQAIVQGKTRKQKIIMRSEYNANEALATSKIRLHYAPAKTTKTQKAFPWVNIGLWLLVLPMVAKFAS